MPGVPGLNRRLAPRRDLAQTQRPGQLWPVRAETFHALPGRVKAAAHSLSGLPATRPPLGGSDHPRGHAQHPNR